MVNERDEVMEEKDLDADIKLREALIEEAKNLEVSSDWNSVVREIVKFEEEMETNLILGIRI